MIMNKIVERIKKEFDKTPDLKVKEIRINLLKTIYVVFIETVVELVVALRFSAEGNVDFLPRS